MRLMVCANAQQDTSTFPVALCDPRGPSLHNNCGSILEDTVNLMAISDAKKAYHYMFQQLKSFSKYSICYFRGKCLTSLSFACVSVPRPLPLLMAEIFPVRGQMCQLPGAVRSFRVVGCLNNGGRRRNKNTAKVRDQK